METIIIGKPAVNVYLPLQEYPKEGEVFHIDNKLESVGNVGATTACLLAKWGVKNHFTGVVGNDAYAEKIRNTFQEYKIDTKYMETNFDSIPEYRKESESIHRQIDLDSNIKFDESTIEALFGNSLNITSNEEYEEWKEFAYGSMHNGISLDSIYLEEEFKHKYEEEKNIIKKFIKSFHYKKI